MSKNFMTFYQIYGFKVIKCDRKYFKIKCKQKKKV